MPFALMGFTLGYLKVMPSDYLRLLILVVLCMVFARSAAMAFNRWLDRDIDAKNPRTIVREIPSGAISSNSALGFVLANVALFTATTFFINPLCFALSPVALMVILGYSYTKRFTPLCHLVLGLGLALAPVGAYIAVTGIFNVLPILLGVAVLFWVAGFDIIYALQDQDFDKAHKLNSIPVMFGTNGALRISQIFHLISASAVIIVTFLLFQSFPQVSWITLLGLTTFLGLLVYQHFLVSPKDLSKVNLAFFTTNGIASLIFGSLVMLDLYL